MMGLMIRVAIDSVIALLSINIGQFDLEPAVAVVKKHYAGPLTVGADLQCTGVR